MLRSGAIGSMSKEIYGAGDVKSYAIDKLKESLLSETLLDIGIG